MVTEERKNLCVLANDPRLVDAGPGAFGAHAARLAGLPRAMQEEVAQSAVRIARSAFEKSKSANRLQLRLTIANLTDVVEMSMEADVANDSTPLNIFDLTKQNPAHNREQTNSIRWRSQAASCLLTITKTPEARNVTLPSENLCH